MSPAGTLRPLCSEDLGELEELCREHAAYERADWSEHPRREGLAKLFLEPPPGRERAWCWVLEGESELAGFASAGLELSTWDARFYLHLDCLYLRERYRGLGWGRKLIERAAAEALRQDAVNLQWQTPVWNEGAVRFYDRLGATRTEKQRFTLSPAACARLAAEVAE